MVDVHLEVLVEPFRENEPGAHVQAVMEALTTAGFDPDMGPFATTVDGDVDAVSAAVGEVIRSAIGHGATALQFRVEIARG